MRWRRCWRKVFKSATLDSALRFMAQSCLWGGAIFGAAPYALIANNDPAESCTPLSKTEQAEWRRLVESLQ